MFARDRRDDKHAANVEMVGGILGGGGWGGKGKGEGICGIINLLSSE